MVDITVEILGGLGGCVCVCVVGACLDMPQPVNIPETFQIPTPKPYIMIFLMARYFTSLPTSPGGHAWAFGVGSGDFIIGRL